MTQSAWARRFETLGVDGGQTIGGRLLAQYHAAAEAVFLHGSTPWDVDDALVAFGFAVGPFEEQDQFGVARARANRSAWMPDFHRRATVLLSDRLLELGKLGRATGAGWYRYPGGAKVDDPIVADLANEEAHFGAISRSDFSESEINDRVVLALAVAGVALLTDGYAAADVDHVAVAGLGFPEKLGGPLRFAATLNGREVRANLAGFQAEDPGIWGHDAGALDALWSRAN